MLSYILLLSLLSCLALIRLLFAELGFRQIKRKYIQRNTIQHNTESHNSETVVSTDSNKLRSNSSAFDYVLPQRRTYN